MLKKGKAILIGLLIICLGISCAQKQEPNFASLKGPYLGQKPPGLKAEIFAPGFISNDEAAGCSGFLNNGTVFIFSNMDPDSDWRYKPTYVMEQKDGIWTKPELVPFNEWSPYNFTVGPDDKTLYFTSIRPPHDSSSLLEQSNIWTVEKTAAGWSEPKILGPSINTEAYYENYPAVDNEGTIYYMSRREEGKGKTDIWKSRYQDGKYMEAENLGEVINTAESDQDPWIAPDGSYLIVCLEASDGFGMYDLYISFKTREGSWTKPKNMGEGINSSAYEFRPYVTIDKKYLFFTSDRPGSSEGGDVYWADAKIIEKLKREVAIWDDFPSLKGPYLGQKPPGENPQIFAPGLLHTEKTGAFCSVFSPAGDEFYFVYYYRQLDDAGTIAFMQKKDDVWMKPTAASFSGIWLENDMSMSSDGNRIFFRSWRPFPGQDRSQEESYLWYVERTENGWSEAHQVLCNGEPVNGGYPAITDSGSLYFRLRREGNVGESDIFRARFEEGAFTEPENIGHTVNTPYIEGDLFVSPDESFLIVSCWNHPDNIGGDVGDLYISYCNPDGTWPKLQNMGSLVNTECGENCPMVSPDGKYFFFNRYCQETDTGNTYWVDAQILKRYKQKNELEKTKE